MKKIAIILSEFNSKVTDGLLLGCKNALFERGVNDSEIKLLKVPGAFELPAAANQLTQLPDIKAVIVLGAIIKGETDHYTYICQAVSYGLMKVTLNSSIPVLFGVLTCPTFELAFNRSEPDDDNNKGYEVGIAAMDMLGI